MQISHWIDQKHTSYFFKAEAVPFATLAYDCLELIKSQSCMLVTTLVMIEQL